jgi:hypothetical protein
MDENQLNLVVRSLDERLLALMGPVPYVQAKASLVALEESVGASDTAAETLSVLCKLLVLRYAKRNQDG